jgi:hypothetical protein
MENYDSRYDDTYGQLTHIDLASEGARHCRRSGFCDYAEIAETCAAPCCS